MDIISAIALITIGILAAGGAIPMGSAFSHVMIGLGGFQLFPILFYTLTTLTQSVAQGVCGKSH